ncbi:MAG TPA: DUF2157 domain-containing protein [Nitrospiria bacterium]|jgi:uncharacterized membrane protein|nr:DUF2157 domain-containing protein [Nitrospiria bacterium]
MIAPNPKLVENLKTSLAQGKSKEDIYKELLAQGWTIEAIQESFNSIDVDREKEDTSKNFIHTVVIIAAYLVGAGIFSFIAANWPAMPRPMKISTILVSMIVSYTTGWFLKEKLNFPKTGLGLFLLGNIIYGAGIFLVAQMFNIRANWPDGFILWMIGTIAMAFAVEVYSLFYLAILLGIIALVGQPSRIYFGFGYFLLTSSVLLLVATLITFVTGFLVRKKMPPELNEFY